MSEAHGTGEANLLKGMPAGAVGGLVASWTMNEFQKAWSAAEKQITGGRALRIRRADGSGLRRVRGGQSCCHALAGIPFGAILFAAADEVALPVLGLSDKPAAYPLSTHLYRLVSHAVYGVTTETVRRIVRG